MINFKDVSFAYGKNPPVLKNINLNIAAGEFAFIVGSSGAGKSSLFRLILRETLPTKGTVTVNGYDLRKIKKREIPKFRRSIGVVFQDFRLIPTMNVFDNVAFSLRVTDASRRYIRNQVPYVLDLMGLVDKA